MTEEFLKRLQEANDKAIKVYNNENDKFLKECEKNKKYIDLYYDLVLSFIEVYDYKNNSFKVDSIERDLSEVIGRPERIYAYINFETQVASIHLHYERGRNLRLINLPEFIDKKIIDFEIVNEVLCENGISITSDLWDGGERGADDYIINFDASILISTRKKLIGDVEKTKKISEN